MTQKSRRDFIRASSLLVAGGAVTGSLPIGRAAHVAGTDRIRLGLIGCGNSGKEAAARALAEGAGQVQLVAMADVYGDRLQAAYRQLKSRHAAQLEMDQDDRYVGLLAYRDLLAADLDLVILAAPPAFLPLHFEAAVAAGKHVHLETPVAVDAAGVKRVLDAGAVARTRQLAVGVGLQHRHQPAYREVIARIQSGMIGRPVALRVYRNGSPPRLEPRRAGQSELDFQLRNWPFFPWLSGDQIVERHVQNLDIANWLLASHPLSVSAQGTPRDPQSSAGAGPAFTQFFCEFTYADAVCVFSQCRHVENRWRNISEHLHASEGRADISGGKIYNVAGERIWQTKESRCARQQSLQDLIHALRSGHVPFELTVAAHSTMTAIMGRMAAYAGRPLTWEEACAAEPPLVRVDALTSLDDPVPGLPEGRGSRA